MRDSPECPLCEVDVVDADTDRDMAWCDDGKCPIESFVISRSEDWEDE